MAAFAKVVFPPPPPTTNKLTSKQRTQLMRSTKKLGRVLGITPQLIDIYPSSISSAQCSDDDALYHTHSTRRGSIDSISSSSISSTQSRSGWSSRSSSRQQSRTSSPASRSSSIRSSLSTSSSHEDDVLNSDLRPLLRLAMTSPSCNAVDAVATEECSSSPVYLSGGGAGAAADLRYIIRPTLSEVNQDSFLAVPTFHIPSTNTLRLAKMDRIRKKLGEDVPIHLIFPDEDETDFGSAESHSILTAAPAVTIHWKSLPPLPAEDISSSRSSIASVSPSASSSTRIRLSNARDSLLIPSSSCRAHRIKRKPVPKFDQSESVSSGRVLDAESLKLVQKERLSLILEMPHELHESANDTPAADHESDGSESSPISTWFRHERGNDLSEQNFYQNLFNYEIASH